MSLRVVLYSEGGGDSASELRVRPRPRDHLVDDWLGPAHVVIRKAIARARPQIPSAAVIFEEPLRTGPRVARGSDLIHPPTLRRLLTWIAGGQPDLAIVLVDRDGEQTRHATLAETIRELPATVTRVIGVAVEEFESWLIGDPAALAQVFPGATPPPEIEALTPRQAKSLLQQWSATQQGKTDREVRISLANLFDPDTLARRCPSFARFANDLSAALPQ